MIPNIFNMSPKSSAVILCEFSANVVKSSILGGLKASFLPAI